MSKPFYKHENEDRHETLHDDKMRVLDLVAAEFDPPDDIGIFDDPLRCYKINKKWAKFLTGMVLWLAESPVWKNAQDEGYSAIDEFSKFLEGDDCMLFSLRQKPEDDCILQQTLDGGATWTDVFDFSLCLAIAPNADGSVTVNNFYTNTFQTFQENVYNDFVTNYVSSITDIHPELGYGDSDDEFRDDALCYALDALIDSVCLAANEFFDQQAETGNDLKTSLALAGAIIGIIALAATGVGTPAAAVLATQAALWAAGIGIGAALGGILYDHYIDTNQAAYNDNDAKLEVLCCLYDNLAGANVDQADLIAAFTCAGLSENAQAIHDAAAILVQEDATYAAFAQNMSIGFNSAKLGLLPVCPCEDTLWVVEFDFAVANGGFVQQEGGDRGIYSAGSWTSSQAPNNVEGIIIYKELPADCNVKEVGMDYDFSGGTWKIIATLRNNQNSGSGQEVVFQSIDVTVSPNCGWGFEDDPVHRTYLVVSLDQTNSNNQTGHITKIRLRGNGTKPTGYQTEPASAECP